MPVTAAWRAMLLAGAFVAATGPAVGEQAVTAFDGAYFGQRERIDPLSGELCANHTLHALTIEDGRLHGNGGDIAGIVAATGFFTGTIKVFDLVQPFEGRIENETLLGGVVSPDGACFWLLRMARLDNGG